MDAERLTGNAETALLEAVSVATGDGNMVGPEHLVDALRDDHVMRRLGVTVAKKAVSEPAEEPEMSEALLKILDDAQSFADEQHEPFVSTEHMVVALVKHGWFDISHDKVFASIGRARSACRIVEFVPPNPLDSIDRQTLLDMEAVLHKTLIGQNKAVEVVSESVRRAAAGLTDPNRPFGSFLFLGPTGVGKTELSKCLANFLYGSPKSMVRIDMSEYREQHAMAKLIGSPPGYVGYQEGGQLTTALAKDPYSVVLFDEMEKAHPDVLSILLQVFDDGRLTDGQGNTVDMTSAVMVMTSNVGSHVYQTKANNKERKDLVMAELWREFKPEFLNRIDEIVVFDALTKEDFYGIVDLQLAPIMKMMAARDVTLKIDDAAKAYLVEGGWNPALGARQLRRFIQRKLQNPLAERVLAADFPDKAVCQVQIAAEGLEFAIKEAK